MKNILRNIGAELARLLGVDDYSNADAILKKATELKIENKKLNSIIENLSGENVYGVFLKLVNSSSYYAKNKELCDRAFERVIKRDKLALMSADVINEGKNDRMIHTMISERLAKMGLSFIFISDVGGKGIYFIGFNRNIVIGNIIKLFEFTRDQIEQKGGGVLVNFSREFSDISGIFDAYKDIKVCRDYRSFGDVRSILTVDSIVFDPGIYIPVNFTDELKSLVLEGNEKRIREYIGEVFEVNIKNKVSSIKFDHLLRIMQNTVTDAVALLKGNKADMFELEQLFIQRIEHIKSTFDTEAIINSYINILRFSSAGIPEKKKGTLNRGDVIKFINAHFSEDLYLEKLAAEFKTTPKYFSNWFKKEFAAGFCEYLTDKRISRAKKILCDTSIPVNKVGEKCGYANTVTFAVAFKKHTGMPPGKFRELYKKGIEINEKKE